MSKEASLTSVVSIPNLVEKWLKLNDYDPLAQLYSKFWGISVQTEGAWGTKEILPSTPSSDKSNKKPEKGNSGSKDNDGEII